jgi:hypothetical protein
MEASTPSEREIQLQAREEALAAREMNCRNREEQIARQEQAIASGQRQLAAKDLALKERENALNEQRQVPDSGARNVDNPAPGSADRPATTAPARSAAPRRTSADER